MDSARTRIAWLLVAFLFMTSAFATQRLKLERKWELTREVDLRKAEAIYMPPNEVLQLLSLGYDGLFSDLTFLAAHHYFLVHLGLDRQYRWLHTYVDAIVGYCRDQGGNKLMLPPDQCEPECRTDDECPAGSSCLGHAEGRQQPTCVGPTSNSWIDGLFPFNPRVYLWTSQAVKWAPLITDELTDKSIYYGLTGIHFCPDSWQLYFDVGFNLYFEYQEKSREEKSELRRRALDYFSVAAALPGSTVDGNFVSGNLWNKNESDRAVQQVYSTFYHSSPQSRAELRGRARFYGLKELAESYEKEEADWQEQFPYVPQYLFHLLGPMDQMKDRPEPGPDHQGAQQ